MKRLTKVGILILVIGLSFLVSTFYRSTFGLDFTIGDLFGLKPHTWSYDKNSSIATLDMVPGNFLPPRDYRMEVKSNTPIDLYVLDAEGLRLWASEGKLEPVMAFDGVRQEVFTFHLNNRGGYEFLCYNPSNATAQYELPISAYGVETDLLYASIAITTLGAIVTIASLITTEKSTKKQKLTTKKSVTSTVAVLALLVLSSSIASCYAQSSSILAPTWIKEGTYANYIFYEATSTEDSSVWYAGFLNGTNIFFRNVTSAVFRWECIQLEDNMARLNVSISVTSTEQSENFYNSTLIDVDIVNRSVYLQNGTLIGTTHLWVPSSPADGQEIILWDVPPDKATGNITAARDGQATYTFQTSQGTQRFFSVDNIVGKINGKDAFFFGGNPWYEYDTGLMIQGTLDNEPAIASLGLDGDITQSVDTNIDMGPPRLDIDLQFVLGLVAIVASIIILTVITIRRRRQRKK